METKTTKQKGSELEREFAEYMKNELGYSDCYLNQKVKGKISTNEYEVDIVGKKLSKKGIERRNNGLIVLSVGFMTFMAGLLGVIEMAQDTLMIVGVIALIGGLVVENSKKNLFEYTWVECKHHKTKVGKDIINNLNYKVIDNNASADKKFDFKDKILVSGSGFIVNALRFAKEHSIECFERVGQMEFNKINLDEIM